MTSRLRARAMRLIRQLDAGAGYRESIERDLAKRLGERARAPRRRQPSGRARSAPRATTRTLDSASHVDRRCDPSVFRFLLTIVLCAGYTAFAQPQASKCRIRTDVRHPEPVTDLPPGSVSVRLIRGDLANNIKTSRGAHRHGKTQTVKTDDQGRAQFDKLPAGATLKATATVDGEKLESQEFPAPSSGGIRLMLVATTRRRRRARRRKRARRRSRDRSCSVGDTRFVIEPGDASVSVYYLIDIMNNARAPVKPSELFHVRAAHRGGWRVVFSGFDEAGEAHWNTRARGRAVPPGKTSMQLAFTLPVSGGDLSIEQRFPRSSSSRRSSSRSSATLA
jgi:hypothetical protein